jgi:hypothetical protein
VLTLVHCGYHKCLTVFVARCFTDVLGERFHDFHGEFNEFYARHANYLLSAVSDVRLNPARLGDYRISRFLRDPRDLVVSGYHYHRKGVEDWTNLVHETPPGWRVRIQNAGLMLPTESYAAALQRIDEEDGLIAEMLLRQPTFNFMDKWPASDPRIRVWKYEDILDHEAETMDAVAEHYGWTDEAGLAMRETLRERAEFWRAGDGSRLWWDTHVRSPRGGQWREAFTPKARAAFSEQYPDLIESLGYDGF